MKRFIIAAAILVSGVAATHKADAQVSLNINIGSQPDWGPVGYDHVDYYYLPDIDSYYAVDTHEYVYLNDNRWIRSRSLPSRFGNYNVYNNYKVVINEPRPWERAAVYRSRYAGYRGRHDQVIIRNSKETKYVDHYKPGKGPKGGPGKGNGRGPGHGPGGPGKGHGHGPGGGPGKGHGHGHH
ncbi:hypothetical protein LLH06_01820 [Mucilaginibacter daejeonensis]|uniref:hypothetical protein n=1 Tax=Mucilaginibacter daejeonensis TaxID=398049 RepID=UPI001D17557B|nr:hypothetical protein [Mucilaginibacter daejeonensis]UEG53710.1 hypothetical protein LLH06_01820 [Mucilaginibacter daejeonensis]